MNRMTLVLTLAALSTSIAAAQTGGTPGGPAATAGTRGSAAGGPAATSGTRGGAAYDTSGGQGAASPGAQPGVGDTGRLGTNHPNAAAGPIRRSGATQTGQGRANARNRAADGAQPRAGAVQRVLPAIPLVPAVPAEGPTVPVPGDPAVPPTEGGVAPVDGTALSPVGGAAVRAEPRVVPSFGSGDDVPLPHVHRETRHVIAPLTGDLEFGIQPRGGNDALSVLARQAQLSAVAAEAQRRHTARRPAGPAESSRSERDSLPPRMHYSGGRWWYRSQTDGWLIWDDVTRSWAPFRPGALGHL